ncbi:MAG: TetR/AcrR family transcriptional regulator [Candidatus Limnocylindrus sp.]
MPVKKISARDAILQATIAELTTSGAETFTPLTVCKRLGIKPNLVNYHFKSREGLIREAAVTSYEEYGRGFVKVWEQFGHAPREHFAAALRYQIDWTVSHRSILHLITGGRTEDFTSEQRDRIAKSLLQNVSLLTTAVGGVVDGAGWDHVATAADVARRPELGYAAGAVSWMISGHAFWKAGPLPILAKEVPAGDTINNVDEQVLAMAFAIIHYFGDKSAGPRR